MTDCGIIFVATQHDRYVEEAVLAAGSAKHYLPSLPITLFTDRAAPTCACFDRVERIASADVGDTRANAMLDRFTALARTPYDRSLYLDTEALVVSHDAGGVFGALDTCDVALVEDVPGTSVALARTGRRMFNCGVILYRRDAAAAWQEPWRDAALRNLALARETPVPLIPEIAAVEDQAVRAWLLGLDKIALLSVLPPDRPQSFACVHTLDHVWNHRGPVAGADVKIHHPHTRVG